MNLIPYDGLISKREKKMSDNVVWNETLIEKNVTYTIEIDGQFVLIENVLARVNIDTGEKYFSPETVERLHQAAWGKCCPIRTITTPVYEYTELIQQCRASTEARMPNVTWRKKHQNLSMRIQARHK